MTADASGDVVPHIDVWNFKLCIFIHSLLQLLHTHTHAHTHLRTHTYLFTLTHTHSHNSYVDNVHY